MLFNGFGMRLSCKFWRSHNARHDHGPKNNLPVASSVQVTSVGYEEIHATWFLLTYSSSAHQEDQNGSPTRRAHGDNTAIKVERGIFIILVSNFADNFWEADLIWYPNPTGRAAFSNDTNPVILRNGFIAIPSYRHVYCEERAADDGKINWSRTRV